MKIDILYFKNKIPTVIITLEANLNKRKTINEIFLELNKLFSE